jgi:hypothetical protein
VINPDSQIKWSSPNGFESYEQKVLISDKGEYYLQIINEVGCVRHDTIKVVKYDYVVNSTLLVPSYAKVSDTIVVIDISWPIPDLITWEIPQEFVRLVDNPYYKHLLPSAEGDFTIGLYSSIGECVTYSSKSITVSGYNMPIIKTEQGINSLIQSLAISPNPARDIAVVEVELLHDSDVLIELFNGYGIPVRSMRLNGYSYYKKEFNLSNLPRGIYLVRVSAANSFKAARLIIQ